MMKKILVPTDFSENADLALKYAIEVANRFGATVWVLHAFQVASSAGNLISIDHLVKADREEELATLIGELKPLVAENAKIDTLVKHGDSVKSICQAANKLKVDLIIMGTKGAGGMKKLFLGSTASNVILQTSIPVLTIPSKFQQFNLENITLALDGKKLEDLNFLKPLLELANQFKADLCLLTIIHEDLSVAEIPSELENHLHKNKVRFSFSSMNSADVIGGIREFVNRENTDMLCLIHHPRGLFQNIFGTSVSKELVMDLDVPLLVFRG